MADKFSKEKRSEIMSLIRSRNTKLEIGFLELLSSELYPKGYRYRKHYSRILGKPDVAFVKERIAIFLDGDFWHGYNFNKLKKRLPKDYWLGKIKRNIARDKKINAVLKTKGWKVLRFWEHKLKENPTTIIKKIKHYLENSIL
ncbi:MAG: very short patch repair endonuclease [Candidatus Portnoybacteria bacterium RBG_13_40_8]|uniref:Very short patch repair endonuclease n=1 Tax=Candidatus Portnoybacteria bacterium RBG_13_40_8 TaxID=1801990 RepID=A0A1G2F4C7_9BACT|nr:MAG: very short patch repair endonuclease [Candidatus Portnoybacteria bacterium RBG_13_40_8]